MLFAEVSAGMDSSSTVCNYITVKTCIYGTARIQVVLSNLRSSKKDSSVIHVIGMQVPEILPKQN